MIFYRTHIHCYITDDTLVTMFCCRVMVLTVLRYLRSFQRIRIDLKVKNLV